MTYAGARTQTAQEMATALHFTLPEERLHPAFDALDLALASRGAGATGADGEPFRLRVVNSIWGDKGTTFLTPFLDTLAVNYGAGLRVTDFAGATEPSREAINRWTADETEGRINDLLPQGAISVNTRLVLVNAIYFNASWETPFEPSSTTSQPFTRLDGTSSAVDTMTSTGALAYAEGEAFQAVEIPYSGHDTSMIVVLPREGAWAQFRSTFDAGVYDGIVGALTTANVSLSLPKLRIEGESVSLKESLAALGMGTAFSDGADFSGMIDPQADRLYISDVIHKAFINVDEKGTEAAAATGVVMNDRGAVGETKTFVANRPFYVFIRDIPTGAVLFMGQIMAP
jgi:serpin B